MGIGDGAGGDAPREEEAAAAAEQEDQEQDALRQMEGAFLAHWRAEDTTKALHPSQRPADSALLHDWLLQRRGVTLDPILSDAKQRQAVGQAAVDDRNRLLLELLLDEPGFSAQGRLIAAPLPMCHVLSMRSRLSPKPARQMTFPPALCCLHALPHAPYGAAV